MRPSDEGDEVRPILGEILDFEGWKGIDEPRELPPRDILDNLADVSTRQVSERAVPEVVLTEIVEKAEVRFANFLGLEKLVACSLRAAHRVEHLRVTLFVQGREVLERNAPRFGRL